MSNEELIIVHSKSDESPIIINNNWLKQKERKGQCLGTSKYGQPAFQEECIPHFIHIGRNFFTYNTEYEKTPKYITV